MQKKSLSVVQFFDSLGVELVYTTHTDGVITCQAGAQRHLVELCGDGFLRSEFGRGLTKKEARQDYARNIAGKKIAVTELTKPVASSRVDYNVPSYLK